VVRMRSVLSFICWDLPIGGTVIAARCRDDHSIA